MYRLKNKLYLGTDKIIPSLDALKGSWGVKSGLTFHLLSKNVILKRIMHYATAKYVPKEVLLRVSPNPISPMLHFLQFNAQNLQVLYEQKKE